MLLDCLTSKLFNAAGLHFTYPKDKKAAIRAAEVLAESHLQRSSSDSSDEASLREHPDDVVSHLLSSFATAGLLIEEKKRKATKENAKKGLLLAECQASIFCTCILEAVGSLKDNTDRQMMLQKFGAPICYDIFGAFECCQDCT